MESHQFQAMLVFSCTFINGLVQTNVYAYLSSMVMDLGMAGDRNVTGYYVGILASMFMVGRAFSSFVWGYLADTIGRKRSLELSLFATVVFNLAFGLSTSYWWAVLMRLALGLGSGIAVVGKAAASELGPKHYKADAMVWYSLGNNLGLTLGTALGGLLTHLEQTFPILPFGVPYLWPNLLICLFSFITLLLIYIFFKETYNRRDSTAEELGWSQYGRILRIQYVELLLAIFILNSCMGTAMSELVPLWCWADREHGGLNYTTGEIGLTFSVATVFILVFQSLLYSPFEKRYGQLWLIKASCLLRIPIVALQVEIDRLSGWYEMPGLIAGVFMYRLMYTVAETSLFLLTNNAVPNNYRGKFNGLLMGLNSGARAFIPAIFGWGFAWSLEYNSFPFDDHLMFYVIILVTALTLSLTLKLNRKVEIDFEDRSKLI